MVGYILPKHALPPELDTVVTIIGLLYVMALPTWIIFNLIRSAVKFAKTDY